MLKLRVADSNKFIFIFPENCHLFLVLKHRLWGFAIVVVRIQILDPHQLTWIRIQMWVRVLDPGCKNRL